MASDEDWDLIKRNWKRGEVVSGTVVRHQEYGYFVDLGLAFEGLVQRPDVRERETGPVKMTDYPPIGSKIDAVVLGFKEDPRRQIWLGTKASDFRISASPGSEIA